MCLTPWSILLPREFKTTFGLGGEECYDCSRWHWYNSVAAASPAAGGASRGPGRVVSLSLSLSLHWHLAAGTSLTCHREAGCGFVFDWHIPSHSRGCLYVWPPLARQVCFTFYLMNCSHEVIHRLATILLGAKFFFYYYYFSHTKVVVLICVAPGLIFSLKGLLSNNEIKNLLLAQCYYLPQIKRFPV